MAEIKIILEELKKRLGTLYGKRMKKVILYGSWARGKATGESDIDLAIVLDGEVRSGKEIDRMIDIITDLNLEHRVLLSVYPVSENDYLNLKSPLLMNLRREGVPV